MSTRSGGRDRPGTTKSAPLRQRCALCEAFTSTGLWPPTELNAVPRTIFDDEKTRHFYDQLAWLSEPDGTSLLQSLTYGQPAGTFYFIPHVFRGLNRSEVSRRISDHYPLWCEFLLD